MTKPSARLAELGITLPPPARPAFAYVPVVRHGDVLFVSGQLPKVDGEVRTTGAVGGEVSISDASRAARICTLQGLACAAEAAGDIDGVAGVLRVTGYVASIPDFHDQPAVIDAASELLEQVFADAGRHARSAVGVAALPRRASVEIEFTLAAHPTYRRSR